MSTTQLHDRVMGLGSLPQVVLTSRPLFPRGGRLIRKTARFFGYEHRLLHVFFQEYNKLVKPQRAEKAQSPEPQLPRAAKNRTRVSTHERKAS